MGKKRDYGGSEDSPPKMTAEELKLRDERMRAAVATTGTADPTGWSPVAALGAQYYAVRDDSDVGDGPKLLITPIFHDLSRFFPVFSGTFGRAPWIPGVQTLKMGERWGKMGKKWVKNEIAGVQKTALMHASAHLPGGVQKRVLPAALRLRRAGAHRGGLQQPRTYKSRDCCWQEWVA